jgi:hypothetical protein
VNIPTMGRKIDSDKVVVVLKTIQEHDGQFRANDVAKQLGLHPQEVARLLPAIGELTETLLSEDDKGFLSIFNQSAVFPTRVGVNRAGTPSSLRVGSNNKTGLENPIGGDKPARHHTSLRVPAPSPVGPRIPPDTSRCQLGRLSVVSENLATY